jgi:hypothetical protein
VFVTAGEVIEQLFGAFISWHTCTLKSRRRIASPEIRTKRMSIFKLQHGMAGHKMVLRRSNMRKRMSALGPNCDIELCPRHGSFTLGSGHPT